MRILYAVIAMAIFYVAFYMIEGMILAIRMNKAGLEDLEVETRREIWDLLSQVIIDKTRVLARVSAIVIGVGTYIYLGI